MTRPSAEPLAEMVPPREFRGAEVRLEGVVKTYRSVTLAIRAGE